MGERKPVNVRYLYKKKILTGHLSNSVWLEKKLKGSIVVVVP